MLFAPILHHCKGHIKEDKKERARGTRGRDEKGVKILIGTH
jgi:hypothetical protein